MELVSVVIPVFNAERYLRETLDSVLSQTYGARELIVVDDGSTDGTGAILAEYGDRIRILRQSNRGSAAARNAGVEVARGTWIAFVDADDIWAPEKLSRQLEHCGSFPISYTESVYFGESLLREVRRSEVIGVHSGKVLEHLLIRNFISNSSVVLRRNLFLEYGGFDERLPGVEDWALYLRICANHQIGYLPEPMVRYRLHQQGKSMSTRKRLKDHLRIIDESFRSDGVGSKLPHLRRQALASSYQINGHFAAESGDWSFAAYCAVRSLQYAPVSPRVWKNLAKSLLIPVGFRY